MKLIFILALTVIVGWGDVFGDETSITVGNVKISTFSPVDITKLEHSTNIYLYAKNNGSQKVTLVSDGAPWMPGMIFWTHFFWLFNIDGIELDPGEEATLEFMIANQGVGDADLQFGFSIKETSETGTLYLRVRSDVSPSFGDLSMNATVAGQITNSSNQPVSNIEVKLYMYNGRECLTGQTDSQGNYSILCPGIEEIEEALGSRPLPYSSLGYFLLVEKDGYSLVYKGDIKPKRNGTETVNLSIDPANSRSYNKIGELTSEGAYGYWWIFPNADYTGLAAAQARHPAQLDVAGHFLMTDLNGQELWNISTNNECWGFDFSSNGLIAAGCHDGTIYMANTSGNTIWTIKEMNMVREIEFSPDGDYLFVGPCNGMDAGLLNADTGNVVWSHSVGDHWLRNSRFSSDGKRIIAGFSGGKLNMLTDSGTLLWAAYIGEFPMVLEIDDQYNVYAAGKNRELFSYDSAGNLRWRQRIPNHVVTAGSDNMPDDGSLIVLGTVGGFVIAIDSSGEIAWQRPLSGTLQGHNALDVTPDGKWIVVGSAGTEGNSGTVALFDSSGTKIWSHNSEDRRDTGQFSYPYDYDHNHRGAITVAISDDAKFIDIESPSYSITGI